MKASSLKAILEGVSDNDEVAIAITINDNKIPVITYDVSFRVSEHEGFMLEVAVNSSNFDN